MDAVEKGLSEVNLFLSAVGDCDGELGVTAKLEISVRRGVRACQVVMVVPVREDGTSMSLAQTSEVLRRRGA